MKYDLFIDPEAHVQRKQLPGHMRQRIKRAIQDLASEPRPPRSRSLDLTDLDLPPDIELRRLRLEKWRVLYVVNESEHWVWVLGVRKRPPYDYTDLDELIQKL